MRTTSTWKSFLPLLPSQLLEEERRTKVRTEKSSTIPTSKGPERGRRTLDELWRSKKKSTRPKKKQERDERLDANNSPSETQRQMTSTPALASEIAIGFHLRVEESSEMGRKRNA